MAFYVQKVSEIRGWDEIGHVHIFKNHYNPPSPSFEKGGNELLPYVKPVLSPSISLRINSVEGGDREGFVLCGIAIHEP